MAEWSRAEDHTVAKQMQKSKAEYKRNRLRRAELNGEASAKRIAARDKPEPNKASTTQSGAEKSRAESTRSHAQTPPKGGRQRALKLI
jgi:hypothetical protein